MGLVTSSWVAWLLLFAAGVNTCIGNLMLKKSRLVAQDPSLLALLLSPWFLGGLAFYGINVLLFAKALEKLPVSVAYPALVGSGVALLVFAAWKVFGEELTVNQYVGLVAVVFGIFLLVRT